MRERTRALQGQPAQQTIAVCRELLETARELGDRSEEAALLNMISQYQGRLGERRDAEASRARSGGRGASRRTTIVFSPKRSRDSARR